MMYTYVFNYRYNFDIKIMFFCVKQSMIFYNVLTKKKRIRNENYENKIILFF